MKIKVFNIESVDCTADPHVINLDSVDILLDIALKTSESKLVKAITSVTIYKEYKEKVEVDNGEMDNKREEFYSDTYYLWKKHDNQKKASGVYAEKHKVAGLYHHSDFKGDIKFKLPLGLSGVKKAVEIINTMKKNNGSTFSNDIKNITLEIGVVWTAFNDHSCSDYITVELMNGTIDLSNQDDYVGDYPSYGQHIIDLNRFLYDNWGLEQAVSRGDGNGKF